MTTTEGVTRACDHPGCTATYDAAEALSGTADVTGWTSYVSRGEHWCPAHRNNPPAAAQGRLRRRWGPDWHTALAAKPGPWAEQDLRDFLTCLPTTSGIWRRMAAEVLDALDTEEALQS